MRDLHRGDRGSVNGHGAEPIERVDLDGGESAAVDLLPGPKGPAPSADVLAAVRSALLSDQRDRAVASMVSMVMDAAKMLDPITRIVMARVLAFVLTGAAIGLTGYTLKLLSGEWERVAALASFLLLASLLIREGQKK